MTKLPRVALIFNAVPLADMAGPDPVNVWARAFVHGLRDLGYIEGRNIVIERRSAQGQPERVATLLQELIALRVDVIVTGGKAAQEAQLATQSIPIVASIDVPDLIGLTTSLGRPSRNMTGVAYASDPAIHAKRLQLLKEAAPKAVRIAAIDYKYVNSSVTPGTHIRHGAIETAAHTLGLTIIAVGVDRPEDLESAFAFIVSERADALIDMDSVVAVVHRRLIIDFAARQRLPAIYPAREFTEYGGLMSYGPSDDQWRRLATYVDKILKGAKPADLPFEQPTTFDLIINQKTARAMGLAIPKALLMRADEVIS